MNGPSTTHDAVPLRLRAIRKTFPGVVAVDGADLELRAGEIHALVGENGAGKSTLSAIAAGEMRADSGTVEARGAVGLVHQHFELVGRLRVWQNVLLGREPRKGWRIDEGAAREHVLRIAAQNGLEIDPGAYVDDLPIGVQQRVELLRELDRNPSVLLLDEPTAALAPAEITSFFATAARLAQRGTAIMIVTHKLNEVLSHSQRITVMRRGAIVARLDTASTSADEIAQAMVGGDLPPVAARSSTVSAPCVTVRNLRAGSGATRIDGCSFEIRRGEIVGIAGVEGNGQTTLADALAGLVAYDGSIEYATPVRMGIVPQDRQREAFVMNWPIVDNVILGRQRTLRRGMLLDRIRARSDAQAIVADFDVRATDVNVPVRALSGGNQQKLLAGRALIDRPELILAYNPTRGIDVGAAALVQSRLVEARNGGAAILLISFELDEIFALADRVIVMYRGTVAGTFARDDVDRAAIGKMMAGGA